MLVLHFTLYGVTKRVTDVTKRVTDPRGERGSGIRAPFHWALPGKALDNQGRRLYDCPGTYEIPNKCVRATRFLAGDTALLK
jgi:hypothetical protein